MICIVCQIIPIGACIHLKWYSTGMLSWYGAFAMQSQSFNCKSPASHDFSTSRSAPAVSRLASTNELLTDFLKYKAVSNCAWVCWLGDSWSGWLPCWLVGWLAVWLAGCMAGWLTGWLAGCLAGCLAAFLAGCLQVLWITHSYRKPIQNLWIWRLRLSPRITRCRAFGDYECPENVRVVDFRRVHGGCAPIHVHVQCPGQRARAARGANQGA